MKAFRHVSPFFRPSVSKSPSNLLLRQSLETTYVLLMDFCWPIRIVSNRFNVQTVTCLHQYSNNHRWLPTKYINARFRLSLDVNLTLKDRKNVHGNVEFRSWSSMIPRCLISHKTSEILSYFIIWIWISGFFFSEEFSGRRSLMIPIQLFANFHKLQTIVCIWMLGFLMDVRIV